MRAPALRMAAACALNAVNSSVVAVNVAAEVSMIEMEPFGSFASTNSPSV